MDFIYFCQFSTSYWSYGKDFPYDLLIFVLVGVFGYAIVYTFQAITLYTIGKRNSYGHLWMAFVPFFNTYYLGVVSEKNKIFNAKSKYFSLALAIFEFLLVAGFVLYYVSFFVLRGCDYIGYYWEEIIAGSGIGYYSPVFTSAISDLPGTMAWLEWIVSNLGTVLTYVQYVYLLLQVFVYIAFFQTYAHGRYFIMALFSVLAPNILFPIAGVVMFFVRKNKPMNYHDYMRRVQEQRYRQYQQNQQYGNPYNYNPYNGNPNNFNNPNNQNQNNGGYSNGASSAPDPFDDLNSSSNNNSGNAADGGADPFEDF